MIGATTLDEYREHIEKDPAWSVVSSRSLSVNRRLRTLLPSCAACESATRPTTRCVLLTEPLSRPPACLTGTSPPVSFLTRPLTLSTRLRLGCAWRLTPLRRRSTPCAVKSTA
ncbi:hypothetical protein JCM18920_1254 [Cutibacterium acnes JCM 18920]|nr:hypothetical protein JCM18920_1254 [Cutibacterium acnes JCM 18920]